MTELNREQRLVVEALESGENIFLTGKGGTGKSFVTNYIRSGRNDVLVCAPTGIAAQNVGGVTLHSAFGIPMGIIEPGSYFREPPHKNRRYDVLKTARLIVIDEISMCRIDVFEYVARTIMNLPNKPQVLVVGDFYQLPPVLTSSKKGKDKDEEAAMESLYGKRLYAFESSLWYDLGLQTKELTHSMRQDDEGFITALDALREGDTSCLDLLRTRVCASEDPEAATLCGTNAEASAVNSWQLRHLVSEQNPLVEKKASVSGDVRESEYPTAMRLELCKGARVMFLVNDSERRYVNGSAGVVRHIAEDSKFISVELENGDVVDIEPYSWSFYDYEVEEDDKGQKKLNQFVRGSFKQYPLKLSWAISIHKSQGQTYSHVNVNIKRIFAEGQLYVAMSRCRTLEGLNIIGKLTADKVMVSNSVQQFMSGKKLAPECDDYCVQQIKDKVNDYIQDSVQQIEDRYQEGYDDGYRDGSALTEEKYKKKISSDPGVRLLSEYTRRENEKKLLPPEERNPRRAGRKKLSDSERWETQAVRVPAALAESIKKISFLAKQQPEIIPQIEDFMRNFLESVSMLNTEP